MTRKLFATLMATAVTLTAQSVASPCPSLTEVTSDVQGDLSGDGNIDEADFELIRDCIMSGNYDEEADINGDGVVNAADLVALANLVPSYTSETSQTVSVVYNGSAAKVTISEDIADYITVTRNGAHISITQSDDVADEITYTLSGTSTDGEFYMAGSYKATLELNGLTLTNVKPVYSGAAIHIQNSKRIKVKPVTGTTSTLVDASSGDQKGCLYIKGHAEFAQNGTLNVTGNTKHGIKTGEYMTLKNATINVVSAVGDGINCTQYFLIESGTITISDSGDDGIQCDIDDTEIGSTGETTDHEDEDSGNTYISGGTISISCGATAAKGIKAEGDMNISGDAVVSVNVTGNGEWDSDDAETKAACGLAADGNMNVSGGTLTLTATGSGGKGMKCDGVLTVSDGDITVKTTGGLYYNNGTTENTNYTGNTDNLSSDYYSSPKGIKAGVKTQEGNSYTYSGGITITGGNISATTSGHNGEGIESKNTLEISGGEVTVTAYDDAINSAQDMTISGGSVYARATNNDGIDANGNCYIKGGLIFAVGATSPEVGIDVNSEGKKQLYFTGGTLVAIGGLESGSSLSQSCYSASSWNKNTWYALNTGSSIFAFQTPTSGGSSLVVSAASTPSLTSGVSVSSGTSVFGGVGYTDAVVSGGSKVSLSSYNGGNSGGGPSGGGGGPSGGGPNNGNSRW